MKIIYLVGMMGSGKSAVGRVLARRLGWEFIDIDRSIEKAHGRTVRRIFAESGEMAFRRLERKAIAASFRGTRRVIATGGGAVLDASNRAIMKRTGIVVYLQVSVKSALQRVQGRGISVRPLLAKRPLHSMRRLLDARRFLYLGCSNLRIRSSSGRPGAIAERIACRLCPDTVGRKS